MDTNREKKNLIYPELSYVLTGICFSAHNELGPYARERQYGDHIEKKLIELGTPYRRECSIGNSGNVVDFVVDDKIILELKAKRIIVRDDYYQVQRYLQEMGMKLGLLINFRNRYIKPIRIIKTDIT